MLAKLASSPGGAAGTEYHAFSLTSCCFRLLFLGNVAMPTVALTRAHGGSGLVLICAWVMIVIVGIIIGGFIIV
jgi:hypothetical protein